jgi:hypothetical protein
LEIEIGGVVMRVRPKVELDFPRAKSGRFISPSFPLVGIRPDVQTQRGFLTRKRQRSRKAAAQSAMTWPTNIGLKSPLILRERRLQPLPWHAEAELGEPAY